MRHLINPLDLSVEEMEEILTLAEDIAKDPGKYSQVCKGKKIATLFYEPSTRTRLSFEAAMLNLGGSAVSYTHLDVYKRQGPDNPANGLPLYSGQSSPVWRPSYGSFQR